MKRLPQCAAMVLSISVLAACSGGNSVPQRPAMLDTAPANTAGITAASTTGTTTGNVQGERVAPSHMPMERFDAGVLTGSDWGRCRAGAFVAVAPAFHSCGLRVDGRVKCWGSDLLGFGATSAPSACVFRVGTAVHHAGLPEVRPAAAGGCDVANSLRRVSRQTRVIIQSWVRGGCDQRGVRCAVPDRCREVGRRTPWSASHWCALRWRFNVGATTSTGRRRH